MTSQSALSCRTSGFALKLLQRHTGAMENPDRGIVGADRGHRRAMEPIRTSPPPPHAAQLRVWTLTSTAELQQLRAALQQELSGHPMLPDDDHGDVLDGIVLVATELATN